MAMGGRRLASPTSFQDGRKRSTLGAVARRLCFSSRAGIGNEGEESGAPVDVIVQRRLRRSMEFATSVADSKRFCASVAAISGQKDGPVVLEFSLLLESLLPP
jgi:hypothetical protein